MIITVTDPCKPLPLAFDPSRPLEVEVGCGKGKFTAETAEANINAGLAAARQIVDYFVNGNTRFQVNK